MVIKNKFKLLLTAMAFFGFSAPAFAQFGDTGAILRAGAGDANILMAEYLKPFGSAFGAGLNSGWYGVAKSHSFLGFDLTIRATYVPFPAADQSFDLNDLGLTSIRPMDNTNTVAPTFSGTMDPIRVGVYTGATLMEEFDMPEGSVLNFVATPMVQVGVGLLKNTDVMLRFIPENDLLFGATTSLFGFGVKHDIGQWIPVVSALPIDLMAFYGMNQFSISTGLSESPFAYANTVNSYPASHWDDQEFSMKATTTNMGLIVGRSLPFISVYGGVGLQTSSTEVTTAGNYPIVVPDPVLGNPTRRKIDSISDPIDLTIDGSNSSYMLVGARLKLLLLTISADDTIATYPTASVGVAFSFR
jgi:hypothetical protein